MVNMSGHLHAGTPPPASKSGKICILHRRLLSQQRYQGTSVLEEGLDKLIEASSLICCMLLVLNAWTLASIESSLRAMDYCCHRNPVGRFLTFHFGVMARPTICNALNGDSPEDRLEGLSCRLGDSR